MVSLCSLGCCELTVLLPLPPECCLQYLIFPEFPFLLFFTLVCDSHSVSLAIPGLHHQNTFPLDYAFQITPSPSHPWSSSRGFPRLLPRSSTNPADQSSVTMETLSGKSVVSICVCVWMLLIPILPNMVPETSFSLFVLARFMSASHNLKSFGKRNSQFKKKKKEHLCKIWLWVSLSDIFLISHRCGEAHPL